MSNFLFVGVGGFMGAILRYVVAMAVQTQLSFLGIPIGTLAVNIGGCLLFGFLGALSASQDIFSAQTRLLIFTGFLGSFTTFSTFGNDTVLLAQGERYDLAFLYVMLHLILGFGAVLIGQYGGQYISPYVEQYLGLAMGKSL